MEPRAVDDPRLPHALGWLVVGASNSGKSYFVKHLLENLEHVLQKKPAPIWYISHFKQPHFEDLEKLGVKFMKEIPDFDELEACRGGAIILDDLGDIIGQKDNRYLLQLYTKISHHISCHVITLIHHIYSKTIPHLREICLNSQVNVFLSCPRSADAMNHYARQVFGKDGKKFMDLYKKISDEGPYKYLLVCLDPRIPPLLRVRSHIFEDEQPMRVYEFKP